MDPPIFKLGDKFDDFKRIQEKLDQIKKNGFVFSTASSTTFENLEKEKKIQPGYNKRLIYDDKYYKCNKNPKKSAKEKFLKKNPGIEVVLCPAILTFRTDKDKQHLIVTEVNLQHDHKPSDPPRLDVYKKKLLAQSVIGDSVEIADFNNIEASTSPCETNLLQCQQFDSTNFDLPNVTTSFSSEKKIDKLINNREEILELPIIVDEDDFGTLLKKLSVEISSTIDKAEQTDKILKVSKMLASLKTNDNDFGSVKSDSTTKQQVGSLSLHLSKSKGRPKGRKLRAIGLPAGLNVNLTADERDRHPNQFESLKEKDKKKFIMNLIFTDGKMINMTLVGRMKIKKEHLNDLRLDNISDALTSESIKLELIRGYCENEAYEYLVELIKEKIDKGDWTCELCKIRFDGNDSCIECERCLLWFHYTCVNVIESKVPLH
ncbi:hypothetical protein KQX54_011742 [Cotesia glomerata]|uniref:ZSWIM3 N-terminal domain-containing protein n=1 Tax=Cotesia glomerata TaxID=32391 RepID=A0AAV7IXM8_COTGL|nr:hypothetical protein KQX54_011742 [Cotesia glomerata]